MTGFFIPNKPRPCGGVDATKAIAMVKSGAGKNIHPSRPLFLRNKGTTRPRIARNFYSRSAAPPQGRGDGFFHSDNAR
jgi:hypothetical protein